LKKVVVVQARIEALTTKLELNRDYKIKDEAHGANVWEFYV
jgi:hypothetical protein